MHLGSLNSMKSFKSVSVAIIITVVVSTTPLLLNPPQAFAAIYENSKLCKQDLPSHVKSQSGVQVNENVDIDSLCKALVGHSGTIGDVTHGVGVCIKSLSDLSGVSRICNELNPSE
jgi:hypothetical protein